MRKENNKRVPSYDIMKFIGIIAVIVGHMTNYFREFIFSFHMPLFFILAGYFYQERGIADSFRRDIKHLVYPYLLTALAIFSTYLLVSFFKDNVNLGYWFVASCYGSGSVQHTSSFLADVPAIGAIWFLLALFWCKNIFNVIAHYFKHWFVIGFMISIVAIGIDRYVINLPWAILPGAGAVMFYAMGHFLYLKKGFLNINPFWGTLCIIIWIVSFLRYGLIGMVICSYPNFVINVIGAIGGTYFLFLVSDVISTTQTKMTKLMIWGDKTA